MSCEIDKDQLKEFIDKIYKVYHQPSDHLPHAYFLSLKGKEGNKALKELDRTFRNKIIPLLQEYFYDDWEKIQIVLGDHHRQLKHNNEAKSFDGAVNMDRFIQSCLAKEIGIIGFDHDDINNSQTIYKIPSSLFPVNVYVKIYSTNKTQEESNASSS